jgi:cobalt-precorrin 5A hydrolase
VITTATDVYGLKAFDTAAADMGLYIENPKAIKALNSALLEKRNIRLIDSMKIISPFYENNAFVEILGDVFPVEKDGCKGPAVYVGDGLVDPTSEFLVMRPASLVAGIGCNRGTGLDELRKGVEDVFKESGLSIKSLRNLATIELKRDEEGINEFADMLDVPVDYFSSEELNEVKEIENPSRVVKKYTGTEGVCEAAALLSAKTERLVVPKRILKNMTIAVARVNSMS